ncbi:MAG: hypothetical protein WAU45_20290 [Blastocatellia bacterium]
MLQAKLQRIAMIAVLVFSTCPAAPAQVDVAPSGHEVTIVAETRGRLTLQSDLNTKLNEAGDTITASLIEPIYAEGRMVLPKGTELRGQIAGIEHAKRLQRRGNISIVFDRVVMPWGEEKPVSIQVTAIEDWNENEKARGDRNGKMKAGRQGDRTIRNMGRGGVFGAGVSLIALMFGGAAGAGGRTLSGLGGVSTAAGAISGLLLTKGGEVRSSPGAILRIKFTKPFTTTLRQSPPSQTRPNS